MNDKKHVKELNNLLKGLTEKERDAVFKEANTSLWARSKEGKQWSEDNAVTIHLREPEENK